MWSLKVSSLKVKLGLLAAGLMLSGCMQATTFEATNTTTFKPRDKEYLAKVRYTNTPVPEPFRRAIVDYHRKEAPGSVVVDSDNHYLYYVLNDGKAIRYGITVGEEAMARTGQSDGLARDVSLFGRQGHAVPDSRHQPAGIYRRVDFVGLHPDDQ